MFLSLDHPCIACGDVRKQVEWYCVALGMRVIATDDREPPGFLVGYDQSVAGGAMIELVPAKDPGRGRTRLGGSSRASGTWRCGWRTSNRRTRG
jgi:catechol 2,3-dioxygenase-like lactoylglutathione lyase family enzyme